MTDVSLETLCAQANHVVDPVSRDVVPAVHIATTFARNEDGELPAGLRYSRYENPTVLQAESILARLDGAREARLFGSGLAAAAAVTGTLRKGEHIAAPRITRRGMLTTSAGIVNGNVRSRPELETSDIQYTIAHASFKDPVKRTLDREPGLTIGPTPLRPESRGSIHIKSNDPLVAPAIRPNFLAEQADRRCLVEGMKIARRITEAPSLSRYIAGEVDPGGEAKSDDELLEFARRKGGTIHHPVGTAKMGSDPRSVVDERLRVYGIRGLRVIDASIMPLIVSGKTNAPVIMIAEKAADMIKQDARN